MDAEKDKPLPERSPSFAAKDDTDTNAKAEDSDINNDENQRERSEEDREENGEKPDDNVAENDEKPDMDQDLPQSEEAGSPLSRNPPSDPEMEPEKAEESSEIKQEDQDQPDVKEGEENRDEAEVDEILSSPLPPDLNKVSEEIDGLISLLLSAIGSDESTPPELPISVEQFLVLVEAKVEQYDSGDNPMKWSQLEEEDSTSFVDAVNRVSKLSKALSAYSSVEKYSFSMNNVGAILQRAMMYVEEEFKSLLEDHKVQHNSDNPKDDAAAKPNQSKDSKPSNHESSDDQTTQPDDSSSADPVVEENKINLEYSDETVSNLAKLAKIMISGGYETECCQVYIVARRNALEESLLKQGFEKYSMDEVHKMPWESLEREIDGWIKTLHKCSTMELPSEKKLSETVFSENPTMSEKLFVSLSHGVTIQLLNFAEAVALTKRSAEKLFKFLDIYEALRDMLPGIDNLFPGEGAMGELKSEASVIKARLGETIISIFSELENSIKADSSRTPVSGGAVHPLTKYIMNYLEFSCSEYKNTLEQVFREHQKIERADSATGSEFDYNSQSQNPVPQKVAQSPFQAQITKMMELLDAHLEGKSKLYKDPSLSAIFMMNNGRYILKKIRSSNDINSLMGDTWYRKKSSDIRQYHKGYQRETWGRLLSCLQPDGLTVNGKVAKPLLKERFKSFNAMFDEIHKTQSTWVVGDEQLQSELRVSISQMVIPAYRSFLARYSQVFTPGRQVEKYIKFQADDLETYIDELFDGNAASMGRKKV